MERASLRLLTPVILVLIFLISTTARSNLPITTRVEKTTEGYEVIIVEEMVIQQPNTAASAVEKPTLLQLFKTDAEMVVGNEANTLQCAQQGQFCSSFGPFCCRGLDCVNLIVGACAKL
ncbi:uncharacterized protein [Spinacia oleracea]|uniref:Uncharacterized protein isoform X2 n=1 Tax=Spinacia oleracea TaxID=3562 RepID=A0ABM3QHH5_SPIOL|nr:uncharacterized protein LOC110776122 isoform X2 [Spinacia oleracea]